MAHVGGIESRIVRDVGDDAAGVWSAGRVVRHLDAEQDRWFLWLPVLFGIGIALYFALPDEPSTLVALLPMAAALVVYLLLRTGIRSLIGICLLATALGFASGKVRTEAMRAPVLERQTGPAQVRGFVELVEPRSSRGQRITLRVVDIRNHLQESVPYRVRVRTAIENTTIKPGDLIELDAVLSPPPGPSLPGDYDFARAAWFQSLGAVGFSRKRPELADDDTLAAPFLLQAVAAIARVRQAIGARVTEALPGETGAIANALITGERGGISETTNQAFRDSGLFHILSISGLHMVIMAGAVFYCVRLLLAALPAIALRYPIKKWAAAGAMLGALAYLLISGASFPTVRSYVMISIMFLAVMLDRPALALRNVALAALAILGAWPESLFDPGFQMSFAAVVALVSAYEWIRLRDEQLGARPPAGVLRRGALFFGGIVLSTLVASVAVAPFGIYHFHNTQFFAVLANLIAIPICNLMVMPAALATLVALPFGLETLPLWVMGYGIEAMVWCAGLVAKLPGAVGRVPAIPTYAFLLLVVGGLWFTLWSTRWRVAGLLPVALGCALAPGAVRPDVLIGRNAALVAVRTVDGRLSALAGRGANFELARWLEHDGDGRAPAEAAHATAFHCDRLGCIARPKGHLVAVSAAAAGLRDDCAAADVLILKYPRAKACKPRGRVIDTNDLATGGAHALYFESGRVRVETVAQLRGRRAWSPQVDHGPAEESWQPRPRPTQ